MSRSLCGSRRTGVRSPGPRTSISTILKGKLSRQAAIWQACQTGKRKTDPVAATASVVELYERLGYGCPLVIPCQNPWQVVIMPLVLQLMCLSGGSASLFRSEKDSPMWRLMWDHLETRIGNLRAAVSTGDLSREAAEILWALESGGIKADENWSFWPSITEELLTLERKSIQILEATLYSRYHEEIVFESAREFDRHTLESEQLIRHIGNPEERYHHIISQVRRHLNQQLSGNELQELLDRAPEPIAQTLGSFLIARKKGKMQMDAEYALSLYIMHTQSNRLKIWWGSWSPGTLPCYFTMLSGESELQPDTLPACDSARALLSLARNTVCASFYPGIAFVCQNPGRLGIDDRKRLHAEDGAALSFDGGYKIYSWHGITVSEEAILEPISLDLINSTRNAEIKRCLLERFGTARYIVESKARAVQRDEFGTLYRIDIEGDEPLVMVEVENSTPEADGTSRTYFLRVPPDVGSARQAIAWTFDLDEKDYQPVEET